MKSCDIVGYTYKAENFCPKHIIQQLPTGEGEAFDSWGLLENTQMPVEDNLNEIAAAFGIDREDERTFDSNDFPKVIFADQATSDDYCGLCFEDLV